MSAGLPATTGGPFQYRPFRQIWAISLSYQVAFWFFTLAVQWLVAAETDNNPGVLGLVYFVALSPLLIFSLQAGALLDRFDMRRIFAWGQVLAVTMSVVTTALVVMGKTQVWVLIVCSFGVGLSITIANPAATALTARTVPPSALSRAIPLQTIAINVARTAGPAAAGLLLARFGPATSLGASALMGAFACATIVRLKPLSVDQPLTVASAPAADTSISAGIRHASTHPPAGLAIILIGAAMVFGSSYMAQLPVIAAQITTSTVAFVALTTAGGLGSLLGVLWVVLRRGAAPRIQIAIVAAAFLGFASVALAFAPGLGAAVVIVAVAGAAQFIVATVSMYVIQSSIEDEFRGRVMSATSLAWGGMMPVGGLLLAVAMVLLGVKGGLALTGGALVVFSVWAWFRARRPRANDLIAP